MLRLIQTSTPPKPDMIPMEANELVLLQRIKTGDAVAFEAFYKLYYPRLFRFVLRTTRLPESVEEVIQETLLLVWQQPDQFNHSSKISTWVFGIAYNKALNVVSKHNRRGDDVDIDDLVEVLGDPLSNLAEIAETTDWLNCALDSLPAEQRAVIELTFYDGLPYQEIAKVLDCPENTVKTRMFRARKKLHAFAATLEN